MPQMKSYRPRFEDLEARDVPATLFVSTTGADTNPGTLAAPLKTVQAASNRAAAGDEIVLRGGTYAGGVTFTDPNLTVRSYDGEWAVIAAPTADVNVSSAVWVRADNVTLRRLEVSGGYYYAVKTQGTDGLTVEDCRLHDSGRDVVKLDPGSDGATIVRSTIYNSGRRDASNAEGIDNTNADRMTVRDCHIYNIATSAVYAKGGATDCVIERNLIRGANIGVAVGFYTDAEWMDPVANPGYYESIRSVVRNNVIVGTRYAGIGLWASLDSKVYNNTLADVAQTAQAGILFDRASHWYGGSTKWQLNRNAAVVNNVVSVSGTGGRPVVELRTESVAAGTLTLGNNVYHRPGGAGVYRDGNGAVAVLGFAAWQSRMGDAGSREADPKLDGGFHLRADSPAVNAGRAVAGLADDYDRNARTGTPDAGADEFGAGPVLATPPAAGTLGTGAAAAAANTAPTMTAVADQSVPAGGTTGALAFAVADAQTPAGSLVVTAASSDAALVPAAGLVLGGSGADRTVTVTPAAGQSGAATITLTVTDAGGLTATRSFAVTVTATTPPPAGGGKPYAVGTGAGPVAAVTLYAPDGTVKFTATPFGTSYKGGVRVAVADVTGDGVADVVAGTNGGMWAQVRVVDGATGAVGPNLFGPTYYSAAVSVAAGDVDGDGVAEVAVGFPAGGAPRARVYRGGDFVKVADFAAGPSTGYGGSAEVALGDVTGDGRADLLASGAYADGPRVFGWDGSTLRAGVAPARAFADQTLPTGYGKSVFLAAGDVDGDGFADLAVGAWSWGNGRAAVFSGKSLVRGNARAALADFAPAGAVVGQGVRVAVRDVDGDGKADVVTGSGPWLTAYRATALPPAGAAFRRVDAGLAGGIFVG